jgi:DNA repair exonuclease SbcCD ATPase subunit
VITRQKKPTKLSFLVGEEDRTQDTVATTQAAIDSFLNINHKVLLASMFFGQSNEVNFLDCSADDKRTIIRNFLNLDDIFDMRDKIRTVKSTFYQGIKEKAAVILEHQKTIVTLDNKIGEVEKGKKAFSTYDEYTLSLSLEDILDGEKEERDLNFKLSANRKEIDALEDRLDDVKRHLQHPNSVRVCPHCSAKSEKKHDVDSLKIEQRMIERNVKEYKRSNQMLELSRRTPPITSKEFVNVLEYKDLCRDETNYGDMKKELLTSIAEAEKIKNSNKTWYEVMRFWEKAFSEQGVIKYIISNILDCFNERCNYYLSYLTNSKYFVEFDQELNEKIETDGRLVQYISLSGGEKRKINLAIMLGLKDLLLLTDKSHVDLLFFDEVAENIDEEGVFGLHQLFQEIKKNKTIFVITHNKYLKTLLDSSPRLSIIKNKGLSTIKA